MTRRALIIAAALMTLTAASLFSAAQNIDAPITAVTVYPDRAKVTRSLELDLDRGEHSLMIENLPRQVIESSYRASATGVDSIILLGLKHDIEYHTETPNEKLAELEKQIKHLDFGRRKALTDKLQSFVEQKKLLTSLSEKSTENMRLQVRHSVLDVAQWEKAYDFVGAKYQQANDSIREIQNEINEIDKQLFKLRSEYKDLSKGTEKITRSVQIDLELKQAGKVSLNLEYIIPGATWVPLYDARLNDDDMLELTYFGEITQTTGEDWNDVEVTLSTARPSSGLGPGNFVRWDVTKDRPTGMIAGTLTDMATGQSIVGASVLLVGTRNGAMTNFDGRFTIINVPPGLQKVRITHLDYNTAEIEDLIVKADQTVIISQQLSRKVTDIGKTIQVVGEQEVIDRFETANKITMRGETIKHKPVQTVDALLEDAAGVRTTSTGEIYIRGGRAPIGDPLAGMPKADNTLTLVSGSVVQGSNYVTSFKIKRKETIPSGKEAVRTTIAVYTLDTDTKLVCRPRNREGVFREISMVNSTDAPLMPGQVFVFADQGYLGGTRLGGLIVPGQDFELPFGLYNQISVKREIAEYKKHDSGNKFKIKETVKITLKNLSDKIRTIKLEEPAPISNYNRVDVDIDKVEPEAEFDKETGKLKWNVTLAPREEREFTISYKVEYPKNIQVYGMH